MASALVPLANTTLASNATGVTFSSISQSYKDLLVVVTGKLSTDGNVIYQLNSDATVTNYHLVYMANNNGTTVSGSGNYWYITPEFSLGTSEQAILKFHWLDYSATDKHKSMLWSLDTAATSKGTLRGASRWANTAAITSVSVTGYSGAVFAAGSTFALYGVSA